MLPAAASSHYTRLQRLKAVVLASSRRAWRRMEPGGNWSEQYREDVGPKLTALVIAAQIAAASESDTYMADVLNELDFGPVTSAGVINPRAFGGWAGDGRPVATLLEQSVVHAGRAYNAARTGSPEAVLSRTAPPEAAEQALESAQAWLDMTVETILADAARAAEAAAMAPREWVEGYVRMLNPPSCSRCVVLAGRFYLYNEGFERHPRCDCIHIPAQEADYSDLRVNPDRYFHGLSPAEQDKTFTIAGAQAVRDGADISQVVNARRGMETTGATKTQQRLINGELFTVNVTRRQQARRETFGRADFTTTEGITRHGTFGLINKARREAGKHTLPFRLMPESIYEIAESRADAIRLLKLYGYIT